jgi:MFS transporter, DHA1 family, inner membrane transport protein
LFYSYIVSLMKALPIAILLALVNFCHILDFMIMMPMSAKLVGELHITNQLFSFLVSSYSIAAFVAAIFGSFYFDRFDRKKVLLFLFTGFTLGTIACGFAWDYESLLIFRSITGLFGGIMGAVVMSIISDLVPFESRGRAMGIVMVGFSVASVLGVPIGLKLMELYDWHVPFFMVGCFATILLFILWAILPPVVKHLQNPNKLRGIAIYKHAFTDKNQLNGILFTFFLITGHFMIIPFIARYMVFNVGMPEGDLFLIYFIGGLVTVFTGPVIGKLTDKIGGLKVFFVFAILGFAPVIAITNLPPVSMAVLLSVTGIFFILINGRMVAMQKLVSGVVAPQNRGSFESIRSAFMQLGAASAGLIAGSIVGGDEKSPVLNYPLVGYISIAVIVMSFYYAPKLKVVKGN